MNPLKIQLIFLSYSLHDNYSSHLFNHSVYFIPRAFLIHCFQYNYYSCTKMNTHNNHPSYHLHPSDQHSSPPETREADLSPKKNWGIIQNSSSSNRRKKSVSNSQKIQEIQVQNQCNFKSLKRTLQKSNPLLNQAISDQPFPLIENSQGSNLNQFVSGQFQENYQVGPQQVSTINRKEKWFAEGPQTISQIQNEDKPGGKSYLTKIFYGEHTKKQKTSNLQLFSNPNKLNQQFILGLQSGPSLKQQLSSQQVKPENQQIGDLSLQSKKSVEKILTSNLISQKITKKYNRCNDSINTFATSLKLHVVVLDDDLAGCEHCGYETEKNEQIGGLCRFCYLLNRREKNISFGDLLQKEKRYREIEKRVRARTLYKNTKRQWQSDKVGEVKKHNARIDGGEPKRERMRMASTQKIEMYPVSSPKITNYQTIRNKSWQKVKCMNPGCREKGATLIKFEGLNFCLKCYYSMKRETL